MRIKKKHIKENKDLEGFPEAKGKVDNVTNATRELTGQLEKAGFEEKSANDIVTKAISGVIEDGKQSKSVTPLEQKIEKAKSELLKQNFASTAVINISRTEDEKQLHKHKNVRLNLCEHGFPTLVKLLPNYFDKQGVKPITEYYKGEKLQAYVPSKLYDFVSNNGVLSNDKAIEKLSSKLDELLISKSNSPLKEGLRTEEDDKKLSDETINSAKALKKKVDEAKKSGKNVASVKADSNEMYYHILDVIIGDDGKSIQLKGGISNNDETITQSLLGSYNVTLKNESTMGPYALNIFKAVLRAAELDKVLDLSDMKNPEIIYDEDIEEAGDSMFKSVKPKMTKNELVESVKNITKNVKSPRKVIKTFKVKDIKNGKK
tara:strand:- start:1207 stop:2331 length:1125 start_codon:yes stop_codon:yes gene_type:complete